ncbi:Saf-pilin pilus formation protein SafA [Cedecea davisae]|uniref:Fimbrial protein n=1 Tax=Cedecea davisae DSM 4568 TaxID=566551 RepID=S3J2Q6_9ENTR|nr:hypothetical protein [Cedecea davisae]EPF20143.1 hypothetical protein HMPREF0201_00743 [Cedecea davisae DSM 4568]SUX36231.1 Saf-pilin pilus formation protein SafA [Cedecea davisae]
MNHKKLMLGAFVLPLAFASCSFAETLTSEKVSSSANIPFAETVDIGNSLTMVGGLVSGSFGDDSLIATGSITGLQEGLYTTLIADTDDIPEGHTSKEFGVGNFHGMNNADNVISVKVEPVSPRSIVQSGEHGLNYVSFAASGPVQSYNVKLNGPQKVVADTYTVKTIAYTFSE